MAEDILTVIPMTTPAADYLVVAPAPPRKGVAWLAWLFIVGLVGVLVWHQREDPPKPAEANGQDPMGLVLMQLQAKLFVGLADVFQMPSESVYPSVKPLDTGSVDQRLRYVALAGELAGTDEALARLISLNKKLATQHIEMTPQQVEVQETLRRVYERRSSDGPVHSLITPKERETLKERLGWFGELALHPADGPDEAARAATLRPAKRALIGFGMGFGLIMLLGLCGLAGLLIFMIQFVKHGGQGQVGPGSPYNGVYAETFAVWMALFLAPQFLQSWLTALSPAPERRLLWTGIFFLGSLVAVFWPLVRGVPLRQLRYDIGLNSGRGILTEMLLGWVGYAISLPFLAAGFLIMLLVLSIGHGIEPPIGREDYFGPTNPGSHPAILVMSSSNWWLRVQIAVLACVIAPLVEETVFRGFLYRHLRGLTGRLGVFLSVFISGGLVSFIFAVGHPQGIIAVPALMGLAMGFTLMREWRGSLLAPMVAHGINNGLLTMMVMTAF